MKNKIISLILGMIFLIGIISAQSVDLGTSGNFAILAKSGISTTGITSITGDIGVSPVDSTGITGFGLIADSSNQFSTSSLVTGKVYASDYAVPTPTTLTTAVGDMQTAYTTANGLPPGTTELGAGNIGGLTLVPGIYEWSSGLIIPTSVTLSGSANDVWIFQIAQNLDLSSSQQIILSGGAQAKNIFWIVAGTTTLETNSIFNGNILDAKNIAIQTGATLNGRALSQTAVTLQSNIITNPGTTSGTLGTSQNSGTTGTSGNNSNRTTLSGATSKSITDLNTPLFKGSNITGLSLILIGAIAIVLFAGRKK